MIHYKARNLIVDKKTGFRNTTGKPIMIYDKRGIVFYDTRELDHVVWQFNLPEGEYFLKEGEIKKMPVPVEYELLPLPKPERIKRGIPQHFDIFFADNPYKATVFWDKKAMLFDNKMKELPLASLITIYQHECGHKYYDTEEYCDRYAFNEMIKAGYNPSQVAFAFVKTLSDAQLPRKNDLVNAMFANSKSVNHYDYENDNCDLQVNHLDVQPNDVIYSTKSFMVARPDGSQYLAVHPTRGVVKKVWEKTIQLSNGDFINNNPANFTIESSTGSLGNQIVRDIQIFATGNPVSKDVTAAAVKVADTSKAIVRGVTDTVSSVFDIGKFLGTNLKWVLLVMLLIYFAPQLIAASKAISK